LLSKCGILDIEKSENILGGKMTFIIDAKNEGRTVLSFLKSSLKISSSVLAVLKRDEKGILANGEHVTVRYVLKQGDVLSINEKDSEDSINESIEPHDLPLNVIFENDDIMVIDKPANMPTHPSHGHTDDTLANAVAQKYKERRDIFVFRPIGRLDKNTSGISLIAKNAISASYLSFARRHGAVHKRYIAILDGEIKGNNELQIIDSYMKRMENSVIVRCVGDENEEGSFRALTHWRLIWSGNGISVVEAMPQTGRTHQLRVHFAHIGHPILGDDIYGKPHELIDRHALHAASLSIPIPYTDIDCLTEFSSAPPPDMQKAFMTITGLDLNKIILSNQGKEQK
jgi:23S rRNA pseudouridine1911/1915/1917 synthase